MFGRPRVADGSLGGPGSMYHEAITISKKTSSKNLEGAARMGLLSKYEEEGDGMVACARAAD